MSVVTDVMFIAEVAEDAETYRNLVRRHYDRNAGPYEVTEVEGNGPKVAGCHVFYNGFNYLREDLLRAIKAVEWRGTCMLWWYPEFHNWPTVLTWNVRPEPSKPGDYM